MAQNILVFIEQRGGAIKKSSLEALAVATGIAGAAGGDVAAVIAGKGVSGTAADLGRHGAATVYAAESDALEHYSTEGYAAAVAAALEQSGAGLLVMAASAMGKDLAPRLAARRGWNFVADATAVEASGDSLTVIRPQYAGKALWQLRVPAADTVLTVRPNVFAPRETGGSPATVVPVEVTVTPRARVVRLEAKEQGMVDVAEADVIVAGGRGLKGPEHFPLVFDLARALGAGVGASRAVVDAGWIGHDHQVGQTGKTVSPALYIACGISGAIQHLAGMRTSKCIVAINKDAEAPIFQVADYGIVGDVFEVVPALTEAVKQVKGS